jgi:hypothetical protein
MFPQQRLCLKKQLSDRPNSFKPGGLNEQNVPFNDGVNMISLILIYLILVWILHDAFYATEIFGDANHQANQRFHLD